MDQIEKIIRENCWKFDKGYPDSQEDIDYLKTLIEQQLMIPFTPEEYANMIKKDTGVDIEDIDNEAELKAIEEEMLIVRQRYVEGHLVQEAYVSETRRLYNNAKALKP